MLRKTFVSGVFFRIFKTSYLIITIILLLGMVLSFFLLYEKKNSQSFKYRYTFE